MPNAFLDGLKAADNFTYTENGAVTHRTTNSTLVDLFGSIAALRERSEADIIRKFDVAFGENALLALRMLFWARDIRGGQGERRTFRTVMQFLAKNHVDVVRKNIHLVPEFGRWDDLYVFVGTPLERDAFALIKTQLQADFSSETPSLMAKWLKSENTSSRESRALATKTRSALGLSSKAYRKVLSRLRKKIDLVEQRMSQKEWSTIQYDKIPSKAGMVYREAFRRNDETRYTAFVEALSKGEKKINASTLYPYEIVGKVMSSYGADKNDALYGSMWANLPDFITDKNENSIAVVDVSGSMAGVPMQVSISLGMYMAERNNGPFKDHFITFSSNPCLVKIQGSTFAQKVRNMMRADWGGSTNIEATFDLILNTALRNNLTQEQLPKKLYIITDMEFDSARGAGYGWGRTNNAPSRQTLMQTIAAKYQAKGYTLPQLVFWNVNARNDQFPMTMEDNCQFVSGMSPSIFASMMTGEFVSAYDLMLQTINSERYQAITI